MPGPLARSVAAVVFFVACGAARALGLGPVSVSSDLSSPLRAEIPITAVAGSGVDPQALLLDVPDAREHASLGFPEPILPKGLEMRVVADGNGGARIRLTTRLAAREPVLSFLLRASWPGGSTVRAYTILLDPPAVARPTSVPASRATPPAASDARANALRGNPFQRPAPARAGASYGPVAIGDTLYSIVASAYPQQRAASADIARAIVAGNPHAFAGGDPGRLMVGATLALPGVDALARPPAATPAPEQATAAPVADATDTGARHVVKPGDTLYSIARSMPGVGAVDVPAVVRRLFERNPQAFAAGDMNRLLAGATLLLDARPAGTVGAVAAPPGRAVVQAPAPTTSAGAQEDPAPLRAALDAVQAQIADERAQELSLRERLALAEREVAELRERDAALTRAAEALRERITARAGAAPPVVASEPQPAAAAAAGPAVASAAAPAAATVPPPPQTGERPVSPRRSSLLAPAVAETLASAGRDLLWPAAGVLGLALLGLLALRIRRTQMYRRYAAEAWGSRGADEEAARQRLAALRAAHEARNGTPRADEGAAGQDNVRHTASARANTHAKAAAVHLAYGDHAAARMSIEQAIELDPHRDEHKMMLMTVHEAMGEHDKAREIVDDLLTRREQLSGEIRAQVEQQVRRLGKR